MVLGGLVNDNIRLDKSNTCEKCGHVNKEFADVAGVQ